MSRLLIVSNRLPVTVKVAAKGGKVAVAPSSGGLATGLAGAHERTNGLWLGWPGDTSALDDAQRADLEHELNDRRCAPLFLSAEEVNRFYEGFSNGVLWPLFHYLLDRIPAESRDWDAYRAVNERFAELAASRYEPGDVIWVHDYQLLLVPAMLRARLPHARIGFFLHIPFPTAEVFRLLPWRDEVLHGLLGADLIGFHTLSYARHFANSLLFALALAPDVDRVRYRDREVRFGAFPMGIDAAAFGALASSPEVERELAALRSESGAGGRRHRLVLGVDRLDYTKGIPRRLLALERLLERDPALRGTLRYLQVAVPSRTHVGEYAALREQVDQLVGRINGRYATATSVPINYLFQSVSQRTLVALYRAADVMLVTPLRDGMNLVAKEFVACRPDEDGVLVLSEFAGAASELGESLLVNPYDTEGVADAVARALAMSADERRTRMRALRTRVAQNDVHRWAEHFLAELDRPAAAAVTPDELSSRAELEALTGRIKAASELLLLLDYDGTLVGFAGHPELAAPDAAVHELLVALARRPRTRVHVVSGRSSAVLERWFASIPIGLHAEHGMWSRPRPGAPWEANGEYPVGWKPRVREVFEQFARRVPGSFIEEKTAALAWHYRMADSEFGARQAKELHLHLTQTLANLPVEVLAGNKFVEVHPHGIHKGKLVKRLRRAHDGDGALVVAIGDDQADEPLFAALPHGGVAIHVGPLASRAPFRLPDVAAVRALLRAILWA